MNNVFKGSEGTEIYLRPTGNSIRRNNKREYVTALVVNVARVFMTLKIDGYNESKLRMVETSGGYIRLDDGANGGYRPYLLEGIIKDDIRSELLADRLVNKYRYAHDYRGVDLKSMTVICKLLGVNTVD